MLIQKLKKLDLIWVLEVFYFYFLTTPCLMLIPSTEAAALLARVTELHLW